jgi:flavin reductase (DIM6/NTAB) family NADH-FMN oxidoreductase RutF
MSTATHAVSRRLPCPVVFISTAHNEKRDIMTATAMFVSEKEPLLTVSIAKNHLTGKLIERSGTFTLIIASEGQKELAMKLGSVRGDREDKFELFSIETLPAEPGKPLIPADAAAWFSCRVMSRQEIDDYYVLLARILEHKDFGKPPLLWHKDSLFGLKSL